MPDNIAIGRTEPQRITVRAPSQPRPRQQTWVYRPDVDILDAADELRIIADVPGADREQIDVTFEDGLLTIRAPARQRSPENAGFLRQEFGVGDYHRRFRLADGLDPSRIEAEYQTGVLTVRIPKTDRAHRRTIPVKAA